MNLNNTAIRLGHAFVQEAIADKVQAINTATNTNPLVTKKHLTKSMQHFKDKLDEKFSNLTTTINTHTILLS